MLEANPNQPRIAFLRQSPSSHEMISAISKSSYANPKRIKLGLEDDSKKDYSKEVYSKEVDSKEDDSEEDDSVKSKSSEDSSDGEFEIEPMSKELEEIFNSLPPDGVEDEEEDNPDYSTREEWEEHDKQIAANPFDVTVFPPGCDLAPLCIFSYQDVFTRLSEKAIAKFNHEYNKDKDHDAAKSAFKFTSLVKAVGHHHGGIVFLITFAARDDSLLGAKDFQTRVCWTYDCEEVLYVGMKELGIENGYCFPLP